MSKNSVAAVILAAGSSSRFGRPKQLLDWDGRPMIVNAVDTAWSAGYSPVVVVLGAYVDEIERELQSRSVMILRNYHWEEGISSSIRTGLAGLTSEVAAAVFIPCDLPLLSSTFLHKMKMRYEETKQAIVVPFLENGEARNPVLFDSSFFNELSQLTGDAGGRVLLSTYANRIEKLVVDDSNMLNDVDTPESYAELKLYWENRPEMNFSQIQGIICDMDGVLWRGHEPLDGFAEFFNFLHENKINYVLVTNNSSRTPEQYAEKLFLLGIAVDDHHIMNSSVTAAQFVAGTSPGATVYPIGGPGVMDALLKNGLRICSEDVPQVDYVVVGWDQKLTWDKLAAATGYILKGAQFIGTNPDLTFPLEVSLAPGNGAQLAALEAATAVKPVVVGKPERYLYQQAMERMGTSPATTLVIGDRLDTDILGGIRLGMQTVLVLTGISDQSELRRSPIRPSAVYRNLSYLLENWKVSIERSQGE